MLTLLLRRLMAPLISILLLLHPDGLPSARAQDGATLTVLRGQVAIVRPDGSAVQPAPSGTTVFSRDEIRTVDASGALITFFIGTEIEMGESTVLVVDRVSREGNKVDISLKQVLGSTVSRVQSFADPNSSYRIEAGGSVALVRGSTLVVQGPTCLASGCFVTVLCFDCEDGLDTLQCGDEAPVSLGPGDTAFRLELDPASGRTVGPCQQIAVGRPAAAEPREAP
jgi:hypothetical protein